MIDHPGINARQRFGVVAAVTRGLAFFCRAKVSPNGVIELQVTATGGIKRLHCIAVGLGRIGEEFVQTRINVLADGGPAPAKMQDRRRRDGHLGFGAGDAVKKAKVIQHIVLIETDPAADGNSFRFRLHPVKLDALPAFDQFHAVQPGKIIEMPPGAAEFPVGNGLQAGGLLALDHFPDTLVFNRSEGIHIHFVCFKIGARGL